MRPVAAVLLLAIEAADEAILNSLVMARTASGAGGATVPAPPADEVVEMVKRAQR